jgi:hypothetical protein
MIPVTTSLEPRSRDFLALWWWMLTIIANPMRIRFRFSPTSTVDLGVNNLITFPTLLEEGFVGQVSI